MRRAAISHRSGGRDLALDAIREPRLKASQAQRGVGAMPALGRGDRIGGSRFQLFERAKGFGCLLYTSDAADE